MIVDAALRWAPGSVSSRVGYLGDFFATFAEMLGQRVPDGLDSVSLVPTLTGEPGRQKEHEYSKDVGEEKDLASAREDIVVQAVRYMNEAHVPDPRWGVR